MLRFIIYSLRLWLFICFCVGITLRVSTRSFLWMLLYVWMLIAYNIKLQRPMAASGRIGSCHGSLRVFGHFSESDYVNQVSFDESSVSSLDIAEISARKPSCAVPLKAAIGPDGSETSSPAGAFSADVSPAASVVSKFAFVAFMGSTLPSGFSSMAERT